MFINLVAIRIILIINLGQSEKVYMYFLFINLVAIRAGIHVLLIY